ncbi:stage II sporulation protein M [Thermomonas sp.]|uniref:stage II sporulation protein M n=1 Tax=Thermomonas sp. TaxID=1971895 RepID=UPI0035B4F729
MRQEHFIARHRQEWAAFEQWLDVRATRPRRARHDPHWRGLADADVPAAYRRLARQSGLARRRGYSPQLQARLQVLVQRGHDVLYRPPRPRWWRAVEFLLADFPRLVRAEAGVMTAAALLFVVPLVASFVALQSHPELINTLMTPEQIADLEAMYAKAAQKLGRDSGGDLQMFGFYVFNNISIGLRTYASGLLAGVGPVLVVAFNGVMVGMVAGHLQAVGLGEPFWRFVPAHSAFELTAIVIAGGAGLRLSLALLAPGRQRRVDALMVAGKRGAQLALGVLCMLLVAAFVEAFWSSIGWIPAAAKYGVGAVLWALVAAWLLAGGRDRDAA